MNDLNVFVIIADSWRADFLGAYGNGWIETPNLDDFAEDATLFTEAYSENMPTLPARQSLFTGRFGLPFRRWQGLDVDFPVLAERVWGAGLKTALVGDTFPMFDHKWGGRSYDRGFENVLWVRGQGMESVLARDEAEVDVEKYTKNDGTEIGLKIEREMTNYLKTRGEWGRKRDHFSARAVEKAVELLRNMSDSGGNRDIFFWLDLFDPHEPWDPVLPYDTKYTDLLDDGKKIVQRIARPVEGYLTAEEESHVRGQYAGMCSVTDYWIGRFLEYLKKRGFYEDSLVIFLSDHGEPLGREKWGHGITRKCRPWPYEELAHIPLIIRHPDFGHGEVLSSFVETPDVMETKVDFLGLGTQEDTHGRSLLPLIKGGLEEIRDFAIAGYHRTSWSIPDEDWTYLLWRPEADRQEVPEESLGAIKCVRGGNLKSPGEPELYDRNEDPNEENNVIRDHPEVARKMELRLRKFMDRLVWQ